MRGRVNAIRTFKGLVADLRINKNAYSCQPLDYISKAFFFI